MSSQEPSTPTPQRLNFRPPSNVTTSSSRSTFTPPPLSFLSGNWNVTHSSLPMWKSNRNVVISYTPLPATDAPGTSPSTSSELLTTSIDDLVSYQPLSSDKLKTVRGVDTPHPSHPAAYGWRGKGWLKIASSQWEVLGSGEEDGGWAVTFFQKTLFTPMGIDVYARRKGGISAELLTRIKEELRGIGDDKVAGLVDDMFEIRHDWD